MSIENNLTDHQLALRCTQDLNLYGQLLQDPIIDKLNQQIKTHTEQGPQGTRRQLLSTSVRLGKSMAPSLNKIADECIEKLGVNIPLELYAYNSPNFNAACVKPEEGRLFIMFSSSLLDAFDEAELKFVMGHELGHYIYQHHDIPVGYVLGGKVKAGPALALRLTSWSRYAEISADRAGAFCCGDFNVVGRSLFKLASGVTSGIVKFKLEEFLKQVEAMQLEDAAINNNAQSQDWFMTHPFSPLRVKALQLFHRSELAIAGGAPKNELELGIEGLMALMEPSYLEAKTDAAKSMRNCLFAASLLIANADENISEQEIAVFHDFFGQYKYSEDFDLVKLEKELPSRCEQVNNSNSIPKRMQLVRDLAVMAKAEGHAGAAERNKLAEVAKLLEVPLLFVEQSLEDLNLLD